MNHPPAVRLDAFEAALLTELKLVVAQIGAAPSHPTALSRPYRPRSRRWYLPTAAGAAAAAALALLIPNLGPEPAYAVSGQQNGRVKVQVNRLDEAAGLVRALRRYGIPADITYLPDGKQCASGRYTAVRTPGLTLSVAATRFEVTIPPNTVGVGDTFVLSAAVLPIGTTGVRANVNFNIAHGAVAPCRIIDAL